MTFIFVTYDSRGKSLREHGRALSPNLQEHTRLFHIQFSQFFVFQPYIVFQPLIFTPLLKYKPFRL